MSIFWTISMFLPLSAQLPGLCSPVSVCSQFDNLTRILAVVLRKCRDHIWPIMLPLRSWTTPWVSMLVTTGWEEGPATWRLLTPARTCGTWPWWQSRGTRSPKSRRLRSSSPSPSSLPSYSLSSGKTRKNYKLLMRRIEAPVDVWDISGS